MKLCVADVLSEYVDAVYNNVAQHNGTSIIIATIFFSFQVYCDFGGYSNIAIGAARVMGFRLMENFHRPYFSLNIKEFWKRWHFSLSSWFMDYVYIPLGGNRVKYPRHLLNIMITFLVSGLWHGANWTFVIWGGLHGTYQVIGNMWRKYVHKPEYKTVLSRLLSMTFCFAIVTFAMVFFRANNVTDAFTIVGKIFTDHGPVYMTKLLFLTGGISLFILILKDAKDEFFPKLGFFHSRYRVVRYCTILAAVSFILIFGALDGGQFIYFQF